MMFSQLERLKRDLQEQEFYKRRLIKQGRTNAANRIAAKQEFLKKHIEEFEENVCYAN